MTRYFKKSYKHNRSHHTSTKNHHPSTNHNSSLHSDKQKHKLHNINDHINESIGQTHTSKNTK